ncbi:acyl-CoA dehydrogenase family protein [Pontibacter sp. G13]|uniref:acyl-CoA dehydrogenase family protein n=1 Tax=Pontibacter sp. G13 TaxID=3074898 RepID=UPI002889E032|nr:acyl-CoA dehydrogenase family protein [Pontibacter sp. G13]WNJ18891.1 acyl-CoA dehydrogenase family protein [Pontibacter sp. G13]
MDSYYFSEEHQMFRTSLRAFLDREVKPFIDEWEEQQQIPKDLWPKFAEMGYLGLNYPEKYGGLDLDFFFSVIFVEEISRCFSGGFAVNLMVQQYMASPYIFHHGSEALKQKYLTRAIAGQAVSSIAISEPGAGSDVANIQTRAIRQGDHYVVNGSKTFITNGVYGDFLVTVVKTDPDAGVAGISLLVIDREAEGVSATKLKKLGWHASDTAELAFDNVRVPVENLLGEAGKGFYYLMGGLQLERLIGAIAGVAGAQHALEYALQYMSERHAFGRPINKFQVLRHRVADLSTEIESAKAFVYQCSRMHNDGHYAVKECSMAKLLATELADKAMYQCLQFFGGYGFIEEFKIARMFRDSRVGTIGGGTSEIMREIIAKMVIDDQRYDEAADQHGTALASGADLTETTEVVKERAGQAPAIGSRIKFSFAEGAILLDGTGGENKVSNQDEDAQCTIGVDLQDFQALLDGSLSPMNAFMAGKFDVQGDMSLAMKLNQIFG